VLLTEVNAFDILGKSKCYKTVTCNLISAAVYKQDIFECKNVSILGFSTNKVEGWLL